MQLLLSFYDSIVAPTIVTIVGGAVLLCIVYLYKVGIGGLRVVVISPAPSLNKLKKGPYPPDGSFYTGGLVVSLENKIGKPVEIKNKFELTVPKSLNDNFESVKYQSRDMYYVVKDGVRERSGIQMFLKPGESIDIEIAFDFPASGEASIRECNLPEKCELTLIAKFICDHADREAKTTFTVKVNCDV
jgi:hypothetical protein